MDADVTVSPLLSGVVTRYLHQKNYVYSLLVMLSSM